MRRAFTNRLKELGMAAGEDEWRPPIIHSVKLYNGQPRITATSYIRNKKTKEWREVKVPVSQLLEAGSVREYLDKFIRTTAKGALKGIKLEDYYTFYKTYSKAIDTMFPDRPLAWKIPEAVFLFGADIASDPTALAYAQLATTASSKLAAFSRFLKASPKTAAFYARATNTKPVLFGKSLFNIWGKSAKNINLQAMQEMIEAKTKIARTYKEPAEDIARTFTTVIQDAVRRQGKHKNPFVIKEIATDTVAKLHEVSRRTEKQVGSTLLNAIDDTLPDIPVKDKKHIVDFFVQAKKFFAQEDLVKLKTGVHKMKETMYESKPYWIPMRRKGQKPSFKTLELKRLI